MSMNNETNSNQEVNPSRDTVPTERTMQKKYSRSFGSKVEKTMTKAEQKADINARARAIQKAREPKQY